MNFLRLFLSKPISQYHPLLYFMATHSRRMMRYWQWKTDGKDYTHSFSDLPLAFRVKKHQSVLIRKLGDSDQHWQHNKVINLKIASPCISGILIHPQQTFSFCQLVGQPTTQKGDVC